jgi:hypothetical protein
MPAAARDGIVLGGFHGSSTNTYTYLGLVVPLQDESLDRDGALLRLWGAWKDFDYPSGVNNINVDGVELEVALGYQLFIEKQTRLTGYVGLVHRSLDSRPDDPTRHWDNKTAAKVQLEGVTRSGNFGFSAIGSYTFSIEQYWLRARPAYYFGDSLHIGPEIVFLGGREFDKQQFGLFIEGIQLAKGAWLGLKAGVENDTRGLPRRGYAGISFAVRF